jgi:hypothetical protein
MKSLSFVALAFTSAFSVSIVDSNTVVKSSGFLLTKPEFKSCVECVSTRKLDEEQHKADSNIIVTLTDKSEKLSKSNDYLTKANEACNESLDSSKNETKKSRDEGEKNAKDAYWDGVLDSVKGLAIIGGIASIIVIVMTYTQGK